MRYDNKCQRVTEIQNPDRTKCWQDSEKTSTLSFSTTAQGHPLLSHHKTKCILPEYNLPIYKYSVCRSFIQFPNFSSQHLSHPAQVTTALLISFNLKKHFSTHCAQLVLSMDIDSISHMFSSLGDARCGSYVVPWKTIG